MTKYWLTAIELAKLNLTGLPQSRQGIKNKANRENWQCRTRHAKGGGKEYHINSLPETSKLALFKKLHNQNHITAPMLTQKMEMANIKDWQKQAMTARLVILTEVEKIAQIVDGKILKAEKIFAEMAANNEHPDWLMKKIAQANVRGGQKGSRKISKATLRHWRGLLQKKGKTSLLPASPKIVKQEPLWLDIFLKEYGKPTKPSIAQVYEILEAQNIALPHIDTVRRHIRELPIIQQERGRKLARKIREVKSFKRRNVDTLLPCDVYTADGHRGDFEVYHHLSGHIFRPEIISILDCKTRLCVGWSAGKEENQYLVADALRNAVENFGISSIFYVDNGSGFKNQLLGDACTGILTKLGITPQFSLPYNAQAKGQIERFNQSLWVRSARYLPGFVGMDMDPEARQRMFKRSRREITETGQTKVIMEWIEFMKWAQLEVDKYNLRPHTALPKITDPTTGKRRHMSPMEMWIQHINEGFEPIKITKEQADDLFRPEEWRMVRRGEITLGQNIYFHSILEDYHRKTVRVAYDIHNPRWVIVRNKEGQLICEAELDGNVSPIFPNEVITQARWYRGEQAPKSIAQINQERRILGRIKRLDIKKEKAIAEMENPNHHLIEPSELSSLTIAEDETFINPKETNISKPSLELNGRPIFTHDFDYVTWLLNHPEKMKTKDTEILQSFLDEPFTSSALSLHGFDLKQIKDLIHKNKKS